jgi:hypothetical protein
MFQIVALAHVYVLTNEIGVDPEACNGESAMFSWVAKSWSRDADRRSPSRWDDIVPSQMICRARSVWGGMEYELRESRGRRGALSGHFVA